MSESHRSPLYDAAKEVVRIWQGPETQDSMVELNGAIDEMAILLHDIDAPLATLDEFRATAIRVQDASSVASRLPFEPVFPANRGDGSDGTRTRDLRRDRPES